MFLKSLEIQGFKSFAGKTVFEFQNGITGIVGPNGSGKSNVSDAVKWVLGEQSAKQLRGGKMEDVIFAGTEARKPVGFASVSITFDNKDKKLPVEYDEVTVTRKVFRSGESEYRINGNSCRLRDIEELFYDTGIGKEGYSLIGQGRIDKILSGRADERRELFDEAAGIVKYKRRKTKAIKQLAIENDNLVRVSDILSELETRVGPLKEQSDKAKEYLTLKEELKKYDCNAFILRSDITGKELEELEEKLRIADDDFKRANDEYEATREEYSRVEESLEKLNAKEEEINEETQELNKVTQEYSSGMGVLTEQIRSVNENIESARQAVEKLKTAIPEKEEAIKEIEEERVGLASSIEEFNVKQKTLEDERDRIKKESDDLIRENLQGQDSVIKCISEQSEKKSLIGQLEYRKKIILDSIEEEKEDAGRRAGEYSRHEAAIEEANAAYEAAVKRVNDAVKLKEELTVKLQEIQSKEAEDAGKLHDMRTELVKQTSDLNALKAVTERYEGYSESIRKIMGQKSNESGVLGAVADIIKTKSEYETAIETALGGALQHIVTDSESKAKELIAFLKRERGGRATFLPLDAIKPRKTLDIASFSGEKGVIGVAAGLVTAESRFDVLRDYLLGSTLVVDNIDNALVLARKKSYSLRIVTLEGESLSPGGSLTGGAFRHAGNLLSRRRRITESEKSIDSLEKEIASLEEMIQNHIKVKEELKSGFDAAGEEVVNAGIERNTAGINLKVAKEKGEEFSVERRDSDERSKKLKEDLEKIEKDLVIRRDELKDLEERERTLKNLGEDRERENRSKNNRLEEISSGIEELKITFSSTLQKDGFLEEKVRALKTEKDELVKELQELLDKERELSSLLTQRSSRSGETKALMEKAVSRIEELQKEREEVKSKREELSESHKSFFAKREAISETISALDKELFRLNARKEKLDAAMEELTDYMWREYELTYSYASEFKDESLTDLADINRQIQRLKDGIKKLGDVNVNAIEEFKETNTRYEFLSGQHDDLVKATESLKDIITDLDKGMREQFEIKFKDINREFSQVFKKLFGGGKGSVELEEGVDVLEADVAIVAQPPGKKLQNMLQLSGGERALTAIALLFAIQNLKPSPFCLLDEIEAALDDANVGRFAGFLGQLAGNTQYIVITHRRGTMAAADRLYGITMQEKGISTLVSVELNR